MARALVKTFIRGFDDDVLRGGIPEGHVVLLRGASGTMKSSLAYYVLYHNALQGTPGLYVTLEQAAGSLLEHVATLGLRATAVSEALPILDVSRGRDHLEAIADRMAQAAPAGAPDGALLAVLKGKILELRRKLDFRLLAIDSWDAMELVLEFEDRRAETFAFFEWLRDLGVTSFLVSEAPPPGPREGALEEEFLADGIIHLAMVPVTPTTFQRRVQCAKMRSVDQDTDYRTLLFENGRFETSRAMG
ncbi:MAG TPA: RAD55 family ATPase [Thermoplasmata archaeon]|jgi:circadian clock protein KaiC|nr:RAD55 family ATPase [Thermoplasmata archaeon]